MAKSGSMYEIQNIEVITNISGFFFKENVRCPIWTCRDLISLILWTWIRSLKHLKKNWIY